MATDRKSFSGLFVTLSRFIRYLYREGGEQAMDSDLFERLYQQYYTAALLYARSLCRSRHLAEDMVQEAFCRAWLSLPDDVVSFRSWLFRVLRNLIIDHQRREKFLSDEEPPDRPDETTPENVLLKQENAAALCRAMDALPAADRELLTLYYFARLTSGELAEALCVTPAVVRQRLRRARVRLRQQMEEDGYGF